MRREEEGELDIWKSGPCYHVHLGKCPVSCPTHCNLGNEF